MAFGIRRLEPDHPGFLNDPPAPPFDLEKAVTAQPQKKSLVFVSTTKFYSFWKGVMPVYEGSNLPSPLGQHVGARSDGK